MRIFFICFAGLFFMKPAMAQPAENNSAIKNKILNLQFLEGQWSGQGWMMGFDGKKHTFSQTENIKFLLDSTILHIEGRGMDGNKIIHDAIGIISFNQKQNEYSMTSFTAAGRGGVSKAKLEDGKFYWYPSNNMRYVIAINDKGQWYETGEMLRNDNWMQFFEMTLNKKQP